MRHADGMFSKGDLGRATVRCSTRTQRGRHEGLVVLGVNSPAQSSAEVGTCVRTHAQE